MADQMRRRGGLDEAHKIDRSVKNGFAAAPAVLDAGELGATITCKRALKDFLEAKMTVTRWAVKNLDFFLSYW